MDKKEIFEHYEEYKVLPQFRAWVLLFLFGVSLMVYGMWSHHLVHDPPRYWDHGSLPDTPAESVYSTTMRKKTVKPQNVISPLPEGRQLEPGKEK